MSHKNISPYKLVQVEHHNTQLNKKINKGNNVRTSASKVNHINKQVNDIKEENRHILNLVFKPNFQQNKNASEQIHNIISESQSLIQEDIGAISDKNINREYKMVFNGGKSIFSVFLGPDTVYITLKAHDDLKVMPNTINSSRLEDMLAMSYNMANKPDLITLIQNMPEVNDESIEKLLLEHFAELGSLSTDFITEAKAQKAKYTSNEEIIHEAPKIIASLVNIKDINWQNIKTIRIIGNNEYAPLCNEIGRFCAGEKTITHIQDQGNIHKLFLNKEIICSNFNGIFEATTPKEGRSKNLHIYRANTILSILNNLLLYNLREDYDEWHTNIVSEQKSYQFIDLLIPLEKTSPTYKQIQDIIAILKPSNNLHDAGQVFNVGINIKGAAKLKTELMGNTSDHSGKVFVKRLSAIIEHDLYNLVDLKPSFVIDGIQYNIIIRNYLNRYLYPTAANYNINPLYFMFIFTYIIRNLKSKKQFKSGQNQKLSN